MASKATPSTTTAPEPGVIWADKPENQTGWSTTKPGKTKYHHYRQGVKSCNYQAEEVTGMGCFVSQAIAEKSPGGICSSCLNNLHKEQQAAKKATPAPTVDPDKHLHTHPTLKWANMSHWQRKQYAVQQPKKPAATAPAAPQLDLFSAPAPVEQASVATEPAPAPEPAADTVVTPENQAIVTARALAGKLSEAQRKTMKWLGFEVPEPATSAQAPAKWAPTPPPVTTAEDLAALVAGHEGPATAAQVYELPPEDPLRLAYDSVPRIEHYVTIYAAGRNWAVSGNAWHRYAGMTERSRANNPRRARLEAERTEKARQELNAQLHKAGPLAATFYGVPEAPRPRYTTAEEAEAHEMRRRQAGHDHHRKGRADELRRIRRQLDCMPAADLARFYTTWQRRPGGHGLEYLLDALHQRQRAIATAAGMSATEAREYALERTRNPQPEPTSRAAEAAAGAAGPAASATSPGFEPGKVAAFGSYSTDTSNISDTNNTNNTNHAPTNGKPPQNRQRSKPAEQTGSSGPQNTGRIETAGSLISLVARVTRRKRLPGSERTGRPRRGDLLHPASRPAQWLFTRRMRPHQRRARRNQRIDAGGLPPLSGHLIGGIFLSLRH